jgi:hypothetical protein
MKDDLNIVYKTIGLMPTNAIYINDNSKETNEGVLECNIKPTYEYDF